RRDLALRVIARLRLHPGVRASHQRGADHRHEPEGPKQTADESLQGHASEPSGEESDHLKMRSSAPHLWRREEPTYTVLPSRRRACPANRTPSTTGSDAS